MGGHCSASGSLLPCPQRPGGLPPPYRCQVRVRACSCGHNPTRDARAGHRVDRGDQRALFCDQNAVSGRWAASRQAMATCDGCEMTGAWRVTSDPRCRSTRTRVGSTSGGNSSTVWSHYPPVRTHTATISRALALRTPPKCLVRGEIRVQHEGQLCRALAATKAVTAPLISPAACKLDRPSLRA